jgi:hypothetical protein
MPEQPKGDGEYEVDTPLGPADYPDSKAALLKGMPREELEQQLDIAWAANKALKVALTEAQRGRTRCDFPNGHIGAHGRQVRGCSQHGRPNCAACYCNAALSEHPQEHSTEERKGRKRRGVEAILAELHPSRSWSG